MSALPLRADMIGSRINVCLVPIADIRPAHFKSNEMDAYDPIIIAVCAGLMMK